MFYRSESYRASVFKIRTMDMSNGIFSLRGTDTASQFWVWRRSPWASTLVMPPMRTELIARRLKSQVITVMVMTVVMSRIVMAMTMTTMQWWRWQLRSNELRHKCVVDSRTLFVHMPSGNKQLAQLLFSTACSTVSFIQNRQPANKRKGCFWCVVLLSCPVGKQLGNSRRLNCFSGNKQQAQLFFNFQLYCFSSLKTNSPLLYRRTVFLNVMITFSVLPCC